MDYTIHGSTVFIKGNNIIGIYKVNGNEVDKMVQDHSGDEYPQHFHTLGKLPLNMEAKLLNGLREKGLV